FRFQVLGKNGVLGGPEEGGLRAHGKQQQHHQPDGTGQEGCSAQYHNQNLRQLDPANQPGFLELIGQLPGHGRKQEKGQDEQAGGQVYQQVTVEFSRLLGGHEGDIQQQAGLVEVVVKSTERLGEEEGAKPAGAKQAKLAM